MSKVEYELGQPVEIKATLWRTRDWREGRGTERKWVKAGVARGEGVIVGYRTLSDGMIEAYKEFDGYGNWIHVSNQWVPSRHFRAWLVACDLREKPVFVLPEDLRPKEPR